MPPYLCATRFNEETWNQNYTYRNSHNIKGCIYGTPKKISCNITDDSYIIVLEMLNKPLPSKMEERNLPGSGGTIMGIGLIRNRLFHDHPKIYETGNYNRYLYKSKYRIDRSFMTETEEDIMKILDLLCFKGPDHIKRGKGISVVPPKKIEKCKIREKSIIPILIELFQKRFPDLKV
jgi:hypothetical protein